MIWYLIIIIIVIVVTTVLTTTDMACDRPSLRFYIGVLPPHCRRPQSALFHHRSVGSRMGRRGNMHMLIGTSWLSSVTAAHAKQLFITKRLSLVLALKVKGWFLFRLSLRIHGNMYLWWSLCTLYLPTCRVRVTIQVTRVKSLLLCSCDVFCALINSLVCWLYALDGLNLLSYLILILMNLLWIC